MAQPPVSEEIWGDGYRLVPVPPGRVATIVTYLEMLSRPADIGPVTLPEGWAIERLTRPDPLAYRTLFRRIGEPWLWYSRLSLSDDGLRTVIADPGVEISVLTVAGRQEGLLELDRRQLPDVELAFFGLSPGLTGRGAGRLLMQHALQQAWRPGVQRVWVHTCTLDHPAALGFYRKMGFRPYRQAVEVEIDPRCNGLLPRDAAPHIPIFDP